MNTLRCYVCKNIKPESLFYNCSRGNVGGRKCKACEFNRILKTPQKLAQRCASIYEQQRKRVEEGVVTGFLRVLGYEEVSQRLQTRPK